MRFSLITLIALAVFATASFGQSKVGVVNSAAILTTHKGTKTAEDKLRKQMAVWQQQIQQKQQDLVKMQEDLQAQAMLLSADQKAAKAQQMEKKYQDLQLFVQQKEQEGAKLRAELLKPITDEVNAIIKKIAEAGGYDIVFDETGSIVYVKEALDLTEQVLSKMKK